MSHMNSVSFDSNVSDEELLRENQQMKEQKQCKVCMDHEVGVVFLPCAHLVVCTSCAPTLTKCVICRKTITNTVRVYMS